MAIPIVGWAGVAVLALLVVAVIVAPPIRIYLTGRACRSLGVPKDQLALWALEDVRKERPNPIVEILAALRGQGDRPKRSRPAEDSG